MKKFNVLTFPFIVILCIAFSSSAATQLSAQCHIPKALYQIEDASVALAKRFEAYEKDSLVFEKNEDCILQFYAEYVYCLRRTDNNKKALELVDSLLTNMASDDTSLARAIFLVEKGVILSMSKKDETFYTLLDSIEGNFHRNHFFETHEDKPNLLDLISVSAALFSEVERYAFANVLLSKQLAFNTNQDSFHYFHNWFMIGLNNINNFSYHKANEDFSNAYRYAEGEGINAEALSELAVLQGTALIELDSFSKAISFFNKARSFNSTNSGVEIYSLIGLARGYDGLSIQDSISAIYKELAFFRENEGVPNSIKRDVVYYMAISNLYDKNLTELIYNNKILHGILDTTTLHDKYIFYKLKAHIAALENFNAEEISLYLQSRNFEKERKVNKEIQSMNSLRLKYQTEKKEAENNLLLKEQKLQKATISNQRKTLVGSILAFLLISTITVLLYRQNTNKKKNIQILSEKNDKIHMLHTELNHRVSNNLMLVSNLMKMQGRQLDHPEAKQAVAESEARIAAMSLIHRRLSPDAESRDVDLKEYLSELCQNIVYYFPNLEKKPVINLNIDNITLDAEKSVWVGLIVNELVTNSFKYAFKEEEDPQINISILPSDQTGLDMTYSDNGIGMSNNIQLENITSLGLKLIHTLTKQLDGTLAMENKHGANFKFSFKNIRKLSYQ